MRHSPGPLLRRALVGCLALTSLYAPAGHASTAPPPAEAESLAFTQRYHALQHGGIVRAANSSISCRTAPAPSRTSGSSPCTAARAGGTAANDDFDMFYIDVDKDPNTYNSSRGEVRLPRGARVTYARLYWGGNLRVGEQKPPKDNARVLVAEPGGRYKAVLADTVVGHRVTRGADAFQASADVTGLVRASGSGLYTVAQVNVAMGRSAAGAWGGWTLMVAYERESEPLRHLAMWDGFAPLGPGADQVVGVRGLPLAPGAGGRAGLVAYDGDAGRGGDSLMVSTGRGRVTALSDSANPADDVLNSTISEPGPAVARRSPAFPNTLGYDSDVFDLGTALRRGGDQLAFRLVAQQDAAWAGALFVAVDAKQ
ncbi:DUF3344 domain-containing protein [Streptomyces sp. NPDC004082]|uniref:DUF3344 domain-containing protein n=1 Tax=unclassified Streptomyces TaxID=2593676 RepID=UPI0033B5BE67